MSRKPCFVALSLLFAAMAVPATFAAPVFHKITVQGAIKTFTYGVSSNNVVVGGYIDQNNVQHGVMIAGSTVTTLDDPNGVGSTICWGVNSSGTVVGYYTNSSGNDQAFMYKNGSFTDIGRGHNHAGARHKRQR